MYNLAIISGDGIGQEVMSACEYLLDKLDLEFSFEYGEAGFECFNNNGTTLPEETIRIANKSDAVLFGASTSTPGEPSPIINLRKALNVYANIRPIKSYKGVNCIHDDIDFVIVRENTEGLYSQNEYGDCDKMIAERVITRHASERISKAAFNLCIKNRRRFQGKFLQCCKRLSANPDRGLLCGCDGNVFNYPTTKFRCHSVNQPLWGHII